MFNTNLELSDFSHYLKNINEIKETLFNNNNKLIQSNKSILISGPSGVGKSTLCELILKNKNIEILRIKPDEYSTIENLKRKILYFEKCKSIQLMFNNSPKLIYIDDFDIFPSLDRNFLSFFNDVLNNKKKNIGFNVNIPILCVSNMGNDKKLSDIKKSFSKITYLKKLTFNQCFQIINKHIDANINYTKLTTLIKNNNNDLRFVFQNIHDTIENPNEDEDEHKDILTTSQSDFKKKTKFSEYNAYDLTSYILKNKLDDDEVDDVVDHEVSLVSALIHENGYKFIQYIEEMGTTNDCKIIVYKQMTKTFIDADKIEKCYYNCFDSKLWDVLSYWKVKKLNATLVIDDKIIKNKTSVKNVSTPKIEYSQMIQKLSSSLNFNKKILKMESNLFVTRYHFDMIMLYFCHLFNTFKDENDLLKNYISQIELDVFYKFCSEYDLKDMKAKVSTMKKLIE